MDDKPPPNTSTEAATHTSNAAPDSTDSSIDSITAKPSAPNSTRLNLNRKDSSPLQQATSSIKVTHEIRRSIYTFLLHKLLRPFGTKVAKPKKIMPEGSQKLDIPKKAHKHCTVQERQVEGIWVYDIKSKESATRNNVTNTPPHQRRKYSRGRSPSPRDEKPPQGNNSDNPGPGPPNHKRIYWYAGGGWQMPPSGEHWSFLLNLSRRLPNTTITLISYPLAPRSPAPSCFPQLYTNYTTLLTQSLAANEHITLAGDSSGGNIALCLPLHALRTAGTHSALLPHTLFVIAPSTDLRRCNSEITNLEPHDPILRPWFITSTADAWRGTWEAWDPRVSPLNSDLTALASRGVRVHGVTGGYDILSPDAVLFREKCALADVQGQWLQWEKQMHCFPLTAAFGFPEAKGGFEWCVRVLGEGGEKD